MIKLLESYMQEVTPSFVSEFIIYSIAIVLICAIALKFIGRAHEFVNYSATLLTTLGIFGTFFGIIIGLLNFDEQNIEASIPPLLAGMKTAFITSLIGILASIVLKLVLSSIHPKKKNGIASKVSSTDIYQLMHSQLEETKLLKNALVGNEESTLFGQLKILRSDINDNAKMSQHNISEQAKLQQTLFTSFADKLWIKLQDFSDTLSKSATEQVIEALKQVIVDFNNNLTEQFGENFKKLNEAVLELVQWQENYRVQLEQMQQQYAHGVESISNTESSVLHISEQAKIIPESMGELKAVMEVNQHQLSELENHLEAFKDMRDKAVEAVPEIHRQVEETVEDIAAAVNSASEHYRHLLTESDQYIKKHVDTSEQLLEKFKAKTEEGIETIGTNLIANSTRISSEIDYATNEFTDNAARTNESLKNSSDYLQDQTDVIKQHLEDTVSDLNNTVRDMVARLVDDAKEMTSTIKDANKTLKSDTEKARDTVLHSNEIMQERLEQAISEVGEQQVNQANRTFNAMEDQIRKHAELAGKSVDNQLKLIDESMQQEVNRVMNEMGRALAQVTGKFVDDYTRLTQEMSRIVSRRDVA